MSRERGDARTPSAHRIFASASGYLSSMNLGRALRAGVFRVLAESPRTAADLAARVGMAVRDAMDLLDTLVALGLLQREGSVYSNTPEAAYYLDPNSPAYAGKLLGTARVVA